MPKPFLSLLYSLIAGLGLFQGYTWVRFEQSHFVSSLLWILFSDEDADVPLPEEYYDSLWAAQRFGLRNYKHCVGKERLVSILQDAGLHEEKIVQNCPQLPTWEQVTDLYGNEPIVLGLETCPAYRAKIAAAAAAAAAWTNDDDDDNDNHDDDDTPIAPFLRVAGLYNSGTNAFCKSLKTNIKDESGSNVNNNNGTSVANVGRTSKSCTVPWGKHVPFKYWKNNTDRPERKVEKYDFYWTTEKGRELVLPLVLIRDPYRWMQAMCEANYDARWTKLPATCPNIVVHEQDYHELRKMKKSDNVTTIETAAQHNSQTSSSTTSTFRVNLTSDQTQYRFTDLYDSLPDLWSEWNMEYYHADIPRLLIRFEDTIFFAEKQMEIIAECVGISKEEVFRYQLRPAKVHGRSSDFVSAMLKYGSEIGRYQHLTPQDIEYIRQTLPEQLMEALHYPYAPSG